MKIEKMAMEYRKSARALYERASQLKKAEKGQKERARRSLEDRVQLLMEEYGETMEVAAYLERKYGNTYKQ